MDGMMIMACFLILATTRLQDKIRCISILSQFQDYVIHAFFAGWGCYDINRVRSVDKKQTTPSQHVLHYLRASVPSSCNRFTEHSARLSSERIMPPNYGFSEQHCALSHLSSSGGGFCVTLEN